MPEEYTITLKPNGFSFKAFADETLLDAALRQGVALNSGCRRGICGVCIGIVESGEISYIDDEEPMAFFDEKGGEGKAVICEACAASDLVLDIPEIQAAALLEEKNLLVRVIKKESLSDSMLQLLLKLPEDEFFQYLPGQEVKLSVGEETYTAALTAAPVDKHALEIHLPAKCPGAFSHLAAGEELRLEGPYGDFFLQFNGSHSALFICDADGFSRVKALVETCLVRKSPAALLVMIMPSGQNQAYQHGIAAGWDKVADNVTILQGQDTVEASIAAIRPALQKMQDCDVYLCGSGQVLMELEFELISAGIASGRIYKQQTT